jgi:hypothetical protein
MPEFYISKKSFPRQCLTIKGALYKEFEWVQIEGVPCIVTNTEVDNDGNTTAIIMNSFTSDPDKNFKVTTEELEEHFSRAIMSKDGFILGLSKYPDGKIHISEFKKRTDVKNITGQFKKIPNKDLVSKLDQTVVTQGSVHAITITEYFSYMDGTIKLKSTENFGDPIFNRAKRWCPPINISFEEFKSSISYPAPIGVRPKDFCLPSEIITSVLELVTQMTCFLNSDPEVINIIKTNILDIYAPDTVITASYCCKWCNKLVDASMCKSEYKTATNYIEICHRDPNDRFLPRNVYWGHGDCNRRQGGYTEEDRIVDALTLLKYNPEYLKKYTEELRALLNVC